MLYFFRESQGCMIRVVVFHVTFNNISARPILRRSVLLVTETGEINRTAASHWQRLSQNVVLSAPSHERSTRRKTQTCRNQWRIRSFRLIKDNIKHVPFTLWWSIVYYFQYKRVWNGPIQISILFGNTDHVIQKGLVF